MMAIMCRHSACDGRSRNDRRSDRPPLSLIEHSRALCDCISYSGNRGMQKDMPDTERRYRTKMYWIFVPMMARKI